MTDSKQTRRKIVLGATPGKPVRFSYLTVFEPRLHSISGKMQYGVTALIPKTNTEDIAAVKEAVEAFKKAVYTDNKLPVPPGYLNPLRDGDVDTKEDGSPLGAECKGNYVLGIKSAENKDGKLSKPNVVGTTKSADGKTFVRLQPGDIKSGDWGRIALNLSAYGGAASPGSKGGKHGTGAYLSSVQLLSQGESLGGQASAEDDFGSFADQEHDPLLD